MPGSQMCQLGPSEMNNSLLTDRKQSDVPWPDGETLSPTTTLEKRIHGMYVRPHLHLAQLHGPMLATSPLTLSLPHHKQITYPCPVRVKFGWDCPVNQAQAPYQGKPAWQSSADQPGSQGMVTTVSLLST